MDSKPFLFIYLFLFAFGRYANYKSSMCVCKHSAFLRTMKTCEWLALARTHTENIANHFINIKL